MNKKHKRKKERESDLPKLIKHTRVKIRAHQSSEGCVSTDCRHTRHYACRMAPKVPYFMHVIDEPKVHQSYVSTIVDDVSHRTSANIACAADTIAFTRTPPWGPLSYVPVRSKG